MMKSQVLAFWVAVVVGSLPAIAAPINPDEAAAHVGEPATVCGMVTSTRYAFISRGQPTFLNPHSPDGTVFCGVIGRIIV
jgi:hypothetical protein